MGIRLKPIAHSLKDALTIRPPKLAPVVLAAMVRLKPIALSLKDALMIRPPKLAPVVLAALARLKPTAHSLNPPSLAAPGIRPPKLAPVVLPALARLRATAHSPKLVPARYPRMANHALDPKLALLRRLLIAPASLKAAPGIRPPKLAPVVLLALAKLRPTAECENGSVPYYSFM